jgi:hypothetical protein
MKIDVNVEKLANTNEDRDMYNVKIKTYNQTFEARLEKSDLRYLIQRLDNPIT